MTYYPPRRPQNREPYHCIGPRAEHETTGDNPMRTGRCLICRAFIGRTHVGWRTVTMAQAARWGPYGARLR